MEQEVITLSMLRGELKKINAWKSGPSRDTICAILKSYGGATSLFDLQQQYFVSFLLEVRNHFKDTPFSS